MLRTQKDLGNKCARIAPAILCDVAANQQFLGLKRTSAAMRENRPAILCDVAANQQCLGLKRTTATCSLRKDFFIIRIEVKFYF